MVNQSDFGQKASDCVPSPFCNFLLWWDQEKMLEIPKRGDFEKKAEWVHTKLARYCGTRNTAGTSVVEAKFGLMEYFRDELGDLATLRCHTDFDLRPENLARYTVGANATMLEMTTIRANGSESGERRADTGWRCCPWIPTDGLCFKRGERDSKGFSRFWNQAAKLSCDTGRWYPPLPTES